MAKNQEMSESDKFMDFIADMLHEVYAKFVKKRGETLKHWNKYIRRMEHYKKYRRRNRRRPTHRKRRIQRRLNHGVE